MVWHNKEIKAIYEQFHSRPEGLRGSQVEQKLVKYGTNELPEVKQKSLFVRFLGQFKDFLIILLIIAAVVSLFFKEYSDAAIIFIIVILNAVISLIQEYKAEKSLELLKSLMVPRCFVVRDGRRQEIKASELVPGDVITLEEGSRVPADARIITSSGLKVEEAALTGESVPVSKEHDRIDYEDVSISEMRNMVFMGTSVTNGRCDAIVVGTGKYTEIGKIAQITQQIQQEDSPLRSELDKVGKSVAWFALFICILIFTAGYLGFINIPGIESMTVLEKVWYLLRYVISVAVAIVPEGLAATVTISLAFGVRKMAKDKAIIRRLPAVETLGCTTVICTDKTGTLTKNQMTVTKIYTDDSEILVTGIGYDPTGEFSSTSKWTTAALDRLLRASALCNNARLGAPDKDHRDWYVLGDPTEGALLTCAEKRGIKLQKLIKEEPRVFEMAFDSNRKMMSTVHMRGKTTLVAYVKGAPGEVLDRCTQYFSEGKVKKLTAPEKKRIMEQNEGFSGQALRVLAFAMREVTKKEISSKEIENDLTFIGLAGMIDPVREGVKDAVEACTDAGIKVTVITGDSGITARVIAGHIGILGKEGRVITGQELNLMSDAELRKALKEDVLFARVNPEHKMRVVQMYQDMGERVAVTGDGVNDAPAIKKADIGVAMGIAGTDVTKESADMVLTDDSFATIVTAIRRGRGIYENLKKVVHYAFTGIGAELLTVLFAIFASMPLPITAVQILWIDLGTEVLPGLALGVDKNSDALMSRKPRSPKERMMSKQMVLGIVKHAVFLAAVVLILFTFYLSEAGLKKASTMAFLAIIFMQMANAFNSRSKEESIFKVGFFTNKAVWGAIIASLGLTILMVQVPFLQHFLGVVSLGWVDWSLLLGCGVLMIGYAEILKFFVRSRRHIGRKQA